MGNRVTKGNALVGALTVADDVSVGDDVTVTGDVHVGGTLGVVGALTASSIGLGASTLKDITYGTLSVVHGTIQPNAMGTVTQAFAGMAVGDGLLLSLPAASTAGLGFGGVSVVAGTVHTFWTNPTAGTISPATIAMPYAHFDLT